MKILFTRHTKYSKDDSVTDMDHVSDLILHGLVMLGHEVTDAPKIYTAYKNFGEPGTLGPSGLTHKDLHGLGFTLANNIPPETHIDRTDIEGKIRNQYFDLAVLSRAEFGSPYEELILEHYPVNKIIIIDGKDPPDLLSGRNTQHLVGRGTYFKRELVFDHPGVFPISCSFPREKIIHPSGIEKTEVWALAKPKPADKSQDAYEYMSELEYYRGYARSYFGRSNKKYDWWEYERHYEIIASGAVPIIPGIAHCPPKCLISLPKEELMAADQLVADHGAEWFTTGTGLDVYQTLQNQMFDHFLKNCTTEAVAKYMLETHSKVHQ